ncbi:MAG: right-handed parallel beta-helix repeat-containing protein, partial [Spirochaetaceae bacterium]|nr:right-handed parallel beta-helix repeat-containing protein [Spirochaetaceae bacterium]
MKRATRTAATALVVFGLLTLLTGCPDNALRTYIMRSTDFDSVVYVGGPAANDANRGVAAEPLATIRAGIERGKWYIDQGIATSVEVRVAEGTYEQHDAAGDSVRMVEGVSLYGGYAPDFSERDPQTYTTTIVDLSTTGADTAAVRAEDTITTATVIDGFTIVGGSCGEDGFARAMHVDGASPTISNNVIMAGEAFVALDIYNDSNPVVQYNTIVAGDYSDHWKIALLVSENSWATIEFNDIDGGENGACNAVFFMETRSNFENNTVYGGDGETTTGVMIRDNSTVQVRDNTIDGGNGESTSRGIRVYNNSSAQIWSNTVDGGNADRTTGISIEDNTPHTH